MTRVSHIPRLPTPDFAAPRFSISSAFGFLASSESNSDTRTYSRANSAAHSSAHRQPDYSHPSSPPRAATRVTSSNSSGRNTNYAAAPELPPIEPIRSVFSPDSSFEDEAKDEVPYLEIPLNNDSRARFSSSLGFDNGTSLLHSISTTEKFTQKWPRPLSMRRLPIPMNQTSGRQYAKLPSSVIEFAGRHSGVDDIGLVSRPSIGGRFPSGA